MNAQTLARRLRERAQGSVRTNYPLSGLTTYRIGGPALVYFEPTGTDDIAIAAELLGEDPDFPVLVLGRGSNLVISDSGFPGLVIRPGMSFSWIRGLSKEEPGGRATRMAAGSATPLPLLANWAARRALTGLEFTVAIPGSVGGGVRMNAGAHGGEIVDTLAAATIYDVRSGTVTDRPAAALELTYRRSNLTDHEVVLDATFSLVPAEEEAVRDRMEGYRKHRAETQPGAVQNAGSTFKNPPGDSAGRLVEEAGLKGFRIGGVAVSELHANFFVAEDHAKAQDVYDLVHEVRRIVRDRTGVELHPEVRFVGTFERRGVV